MNLSQFLNGKLDLNKTQIYTAVATEFKGEGGILELGATRGGTHNLGLRPDTIQSLKRPKTGDAAHFRGHTE